MEDYGFEMPTPCSKCGETFDLNDGRCSEKWFPNTTICEPCWEKEQEEIEVDAFIEDALRELSDALHTLKEHGGLDKISDENRALIIQNVTKSCPKCGSTEVIMFTADLDLCKACHHQF